MRYLLILLVSLMTFSGICQNQNIEYLTSITTIVESKNSYGTGNFLCRTNGDVFVLTCFHVLESSKVLSNSFDGVKINILVFKGDEKVGLLTLDAEVFKFDEKEDLSLLKVKYKGFVNNSIRFNCNDEKIKVGTKILHMGNFWGMEAPMSYSEGLISSKRRKEEGFSFWQGNCEVEPGSSGGGIFDEDGNYIGMAVMKRGGASLFIPLSRIRDWAKKQKCEFIFNDSCDYSK